MNGRQIREKINGAVKPVGLGTAVGLAVSAITIGGFLLNQGRASGETVERLAQLETRVTQHLATVEPLTQEFNRFMGELPGLRTEIASLRADIVRLNARLDRIEQRGRP